MIRMRINHYGMTFKDKEAQDLYNEGLFIKLPFRLNLGDEINLFELLEERHYLNEELHIAFLEMRTPIVTSICLNKDAKGYFFEVSLDEEDEKLNLINGIIDDIIERQSGMEDEDSFGDPRLN